LTRPVAEGNLAKHRTDDGPEMRYPTRLTAPSEKKKGFKRGKNTYIWGRSLPPMRANTHEPADTGGKKHRGGEKVGILKKQQIRRKMCQSEEERPERLTLREVYLGWSIHVISGQGT